MRQRPPLSRSRWLKLGTAAAFAFLSLSCARAPVVETAPLEEPPLLFENVRVFVGDGRVLERQDVAVVGDHIAYVAPHGARTPPPSVERIDGKGRTLLPGLIDSHVHVEKSGAPPWTFTKPDAVHNLEAHLFAGTTTVVDLGGTLSSLAESDAQIRRGDFAGPDLYFAGPMVTVPEGYPVSLFRRMAPGILPGFFVRNVLVGESVAEVEDEKDAREIVQRIHEAGGTILKVVVTDSFAESRLAGTLLKTLVAEAHLRGLKVYAHVATPDEAVEAATAGVDVLAHSPTMGAITDKQAQLIASQDVRVVPTLFSLARLEALRNRAVSFSTLETQSEAADMLETMTPDAMKDAEIHPDLLTFLDKLHAHEQDQRKNIATLHKANVDILVGTDANGAPATFPAAIHEELAALVAAGLPPKDALAGATWKAAEVLAGSRADFGRILAGQRGNLLLVDGDPTTKIEDTAKIVLVVKDGRRVARKAADRAAPEEK